MKKLQGKLLSVPNLISLSRLALLPLVVYCLEHGLLFWVLVLLGYFAFSDSLDGFMARKLYKQNDYGKIVDHVVDKITIITLTYEMVKLRDVPFWVLWLFLFRELGTFLVSAYIFLKNGIPTTSNWLGKITGVIMAITFIFYLFLWPFREVLLYITIGFAALTSFNYARLYSHVVPAFAFLRKLNHYESTHTAGVGKNG